MRQLQGISDQERADFEAWKTYMSDRKKFERQFEDAAEKMFDKMRKAVKDRLKKTAIGT
jgi:hypothetical protein